MTREALQEQNKQLLQELKEAQSADSAATTDG